MEPEDGLIWVPSLADESVMAFTDDGVDTRRADQDPPENEAARGVLISAPSASPAAYAGRLHSLSDCAVQPIFGAIEVTVAHREG
jgi:hypothetical protein